MGLRDDLQTDIAAAFDTDLADAVSSFTGSRVVAGEYDPVTGSSTTTVTYAGRGVFGGYSVQEADGQHILATDTKLSGVLQNELLLNDDQGSPTATPATPQEGDTIDGMEVVRVQKDPADASWTLTLRRT
jgi:hypothetical protein